MITDGQTTLRNPDVILRDDFPDVPILYDPATDAAFGLNRTAAFVWKHLDECRTAGEVAERLSETFRGVPPEATDAIETLSRALVRAGLAATAGPARP